MNRATGENDMPGGSGDVVPILHGAANNNKSLRYKPVSAADSDTFA